jgi:putative endonuclease
MGFFFFQMEWFVYIIRSLKDGQYYKGMSTHPRERLLQHNEGTTPSTRPYRPWELVYVETCNSKTEALVREKNLKKATRARIEALLTNPKNAIARFTNL